MHLIVYVDVALVLSLFLNGTLVWLPGKLMGVKTTPVRMVLGTLTGVLYGVVCFITDYYRIWLSVGVAYVQMRISYPQKQGVLMLAKIASAILLAGWQQTFSVAGVTSLMLFVAGVYALRLLWKKIHGFIRTEKLYRKIQIGVNGNSLEFMGYIDSGNRLSVAVLSEQTAISLLGEKLVADMREMENTKALNYRLLPCTTVSGEGFIPVFKPDFMKIDGKKSNMQVGINFMPMQEQMLLPKNVLEVQ